MARAPPLALSWARWRISGTLTPQQVIHFDRPFGVVAHTETGWPLFQAAI